MTLGNPLLRLTRWLQLMLLPLILATSPAFAASMDPIPLVEPVRLAQVAGQPLLVSDYQAGAIHQLDAAGTVVHSIPVEGRPVAVAQDKKWLYVGNAQSGSIDIYTQNGKRLGILGKVEGLVRLPNDFALDPRSGLLYVVDSQAKVVKVFDHRGPVSVIPAPGTQLPDNQRLFNPTALTLDLTNGRVLVSDQGPSENSFPFRQRDARVQIYRFDGSYVDTLSGDFSRPQGLGLNSDGYLFLADGVLGQVLVFDLIGKTLLKTFDGFDLPLDVAVDPETRNLYVTNSRGGTVEVIPAGGVIP